MVSVKLGSEKCKTGRRNGKIVCFGLIVDGSRTGACYFAVDRSSTTSRCLPRKMENEGQDIGYRRSLPRAARRWARFLVQVTVLGCAGPSATRKPASASRYSGSAASSLP